MVDNWFIVAAYDEGYTLHVYPFHSILRRIKKVKKCYRVLEYKLCPSINRILKIERVAENRVSVVTESKVLDFRID